MELENLKQLCKNYKKLETLLEEIAADLARKNNLRYKYLHRFEIYDNETISIVVGDWEVGDRDNGYFTFTLEQIANYKKNK